MEEDIKNKWKGIDLNRNYSDLEIFLEREEYIKNVNTKGTLEYKLNERFKHMSLSQFLKHTSE
jgi:hypothetical protein